MAILDLFFFIILITRVDVRSESPDLKSGMRRKGSGALGQALRCPHGSLLAQVLGSSSANDVRINEEPQALSPSEY